MGAIVWKVAHFGKGAAAWRYVDAPGVDWYTRTS